MPNRNRSQTPIRSPRYAPPVHAATGPVLALPADAHASFQRDLSGSLKRAAAIREVPSHMHRATTPAMFPDRLTYGGMPITLELHATVRS